MSATAYRDYWSVAESEVESKTGAAGLMDCPDIRDVLDHLDLDLSSKMVLDVGCGTGRLARLCGKYMGVDVSPAMVSYCTSRGIRAHTVNSPLELRELEVEWGVKPFDIVTCLSVFTHISRSDRQSYLHSFRHMAPELLVDILPGDTESGSIPYWVADTEAFELDVVEAGWEIVDSYLRVARDGTGHLYFHCR